jgi:hypothetical protein
MTHPPIPVQVIRPADWNRVLRKIGAKKNRSYYGSASGAGFLHPWRTTAGYDVESNLWGIRIQPGYINAAETEVPAMAARLAPRETRERLGLGAGSTRPARPWLSERPWMRIPADLWRSIGTGETGSDPVPDFFQALGVEGSAQIVIDAEDQSVSVVAPPPVPVERRRYLRAVDVVLTVPKPAIRAVLVPTESGGTRIDYTVAPGTGSPFLSIRRRYDPRPPAPSLQEQLVTGRTDDNYIEKRVVTVYLLSPAGTKFGAPIGRDWAPYFAHGLFYNLVSASRVILNIIPPSSLSSTIPLAGGAGQSIIESILDDLNARDAELSLALSQAGVLTHFHSV